MNNRRKGRRYEILAKKYYEDEGYKVILAPMSQKWQKSQDFFGLFDLIGVKKEYELTSSIHDSALGRIQVPRKIFVQVKYGQKRGALAAIRKFSFDFLGQRDKAVLLVWEPGKGFVEYD